MVAGTWTEKSASGTLTTGGSPTQFVVGSYAYILSTFNNNLYVYDSVNDTWSIKATFPPRDRMGAGAFVIGTMGYICCGYVAFPAPYYIDDLWQYNTVNNSWLQKADFPGSSREGVVAFGDSSTGFCGLGYEPYTNVQDFYRYNQSSNTWTTMNNGPSLRDPPHTNNSTHGYTIFENTYKKYFWVYNKSTDTWTQKTDYPGTARRAGACFILHNIFFAGSGQLSGGGYVYDWYGYDLSTNIWSVTTSLAAGKYWANYWSINDIGYVMNGYTNTNWAFEVIITYIISGTVYTSQSNPIASATVRAAGGSYYPTTSDSTGAYSLTVDPGIYEVTASKTNYHSDSHSVDASASDQTQDFTLTNPQASLSGGAGDRIIRKMSHHYIMTKTGRHW